jgi:hypothetical protein
MSRFERAKYAGSLAATKLPGLSSRFHFWFGGSGRRYPVSVYAPAAVPPYDLAISLYVKRSAEGPAVIAISAGHADEPAPAGTDEVHVHVVERVEALAFAHRDLRDLLCDANLPSGAPDGDGTLLPFTPRRAA